MGSEDPVYLGGLVHLQLHVGLGRTSFDRTMFYLVRWCNLVLRPAPLLSVFARRLGLGVACDAAQQAGGIFPGGFRRAPCLDALRFVHYEFSLYVFSAMGTFHCDLLRSGSSTSLDRGVGGQDRTAGRNA
ncbi:MAG: hypothetical protein OES34_10885, partial [Nitrosopumilus sp.]|nr:hypothetical protein [Nitrosopumilus sp.]